MPVQTRSQTRAIALTQQQTEVHFIKRQEDFKNLMNYLRENFNFTDELSEFYTSIYVSPTKFHMINYWTFHSVNEIFKNSSNYKNFIDIASRYIGMGWVEIISYSPNTQKFFYRCDGGSSGHEVEYNQRLFQNFCLSGSDKSRFPPYNFGEMIQRTSQEFRGIY